MRARCLALLLVAATACGGAQRDAGTGAPPPDATPELFFDRDTARDLADGILDVLDTMAAIVDQRAGAGECTAMADDLEDLFDRSEPMFELARAAAQDPDHARVLTEEMRRHDAAVAPLVERISPGLATCRSEPRLVEIMDRMPVL